MFKLECLGAKHGDCLLIHYGDSSEPRFVLIDGGPGGVYSRFLRPRLKQLRSEHSDGAPLRVELGMVSHIDDDHINGLLQLTDELIAQQISLNDLVEFRAFWHNSFADITGGTETAAVFAASNAITASLSAGGTAPFDVLRNSDGRAENILASINQGRRLRDNIKKLGLDGNRPFDGLVSSGREVDLRGDLKLTVIGPSQKRLEDLQREWNPALTAVNIAEFSDKSIANLSSIVVLAEFEGKTILFTGDARGDHILEDLEENDLLTNGVFEVDVLKVPHHGSDRNVTVDFFKAVPAKTYVISGDGKHDNPEPEMFRMIRDARAGDTGYTIVIVSPVTMEHSQKTAPFEQELQALRDAGADIKFRDPDDLSITVILA